MAVFPASSLIFVGIANELSDIPTLGDGPGAMFTGIRDGQGAFVAQTGTLWTLQASSDPVSSTCALTRDDPSRRWKETSGGGGGAGTVTNVSGTAPIQVATGTTTPVISIDAATDSLPGSLSAADKTFIDYLAARWENAQAGVLGALIPGLSFEAMKFGLAGSGAITASLAAQSGDALIEGGGITGPGGYRMLGLTNYQAMLSKKWAWGFEGTLPVVGTDESDVGYFGAVAGHYVAFNTNVANDATHVCFLLANGGTPTKIVTSLVADNVKRTYSATFDLTTVKVYANGVQIGSTATLTQLGDFAAAPTVYCTVATNAKITKWIYGYDPA